MAIFQRIIYCCKFALCNTPHFIKHFKKFSSVFSYQNRFRSDDVTMIREWPRKLAEQSLQFTRVWLSKDKYNLREPLNCASLLMSINGYHRHTISLTYLTTFRLLYFAVCMQVFVLPDRLSRTNVHLPLVKLVQNVTQKTSALSHVFTAFQAALSCVEFLLVRTSDKFFTKSI